MPGADPDARRARPSPAAAVTGLLPSAGVGGGVLGRGGARPGAPLSEPPFVTCGDILPSDVAAPYAVRRGPENAGEDDMVECGQRDVVRCRQTSLMTTAIDISASRAA
ncbi:hypothetical protein GCM10011512_08980 [Tersicoccus solisilvae]|uniref:Uncharacterized protein n=1 Tax=Tersicoccus solisilvae TaxID=1882339 RepID=A0ABQ1NVN1_9MICC|nr:hypothetical protein GCM10011512_08980 [Tersicoccus solisilvae]